MVEQLMDSSARVVLQKDEIDTGPARRPKHEASAAAGSANQVRATHVSVRSGAQSAEDEVRTPGTHPVRNVEPCARIKTSRAVEAPTKSFAPALTIKLSWLLCTGHCVHKLGGGGAPRLPRL